MRGGGKHQMLLIFRALSINSAQLGAQARALAQLLEAELKPKLSSVQLSLAQAHSAMVSTWAQAQVQLVYGLSLNLFLFFFYFISALYLNINDMCDKQGRSL